MQDRKAPQQTSGLVGLCALRTTLEETKKKGRGKQSQFREAGPPAKPQAAFYRQRCKLSERRQQGAGSGKTTATPGPPVPPHFSYFPAQIGGCGRGRAGAGMAVRVALLLGVLLATLRLGDTGEAPLGWAWGMLGAVRLSGFKVGDPGGTWREMHCSETVLEWAAGFGVMREPWPCAPPAILEANGNLSCRCLKSTRTFISPEKYSSIEVWPVGSSCRRLEVV